MLDVTSALRTVAAGVGLKEIEEDRDGRNLEAIKCMQSKWKFWNASEKVILQV